MVAQRAAGLAKRARIVLLAAEGKPNAEIARMVGVSRPTVIGWRDRYAQGGIAALKDGPRTLSWRRRSATPRPVIESGMSYTW
jgi:transposase